MCGIIGYVGTKNALDVIIAGLEYLEYRGYDSAGVAINTSANDLVIKKSAGKLSVLKDALKLQTIPGSVGMGHTRWATHGTPTSINAHPHRYGQVTLIHNGIVENHKIIRQKLVEHGHQFYSETDTEVAAHLLDNFLHEIRDPIQALSMLADTIQGNYSFAVMIDAYPDRIYFAKNGSPLIVAEGLGESFLASDQGALLLHQVKFYSLNDLEIGFIDSDGGHIFDLKGEEKNISWSSLIAKKENIGKLHYKHFMHKEIFEQPATLDRVLQGRLDENGINFAGFDLDFKKIAYANKIEIVACGSAYYASLIARPALEAVVRLPVSVEIASEYRYRQTLTDDKTLVIAVSQSGETADTLASIKKARGIGAMCMSICNVVGSAIPQICQNSLGNLFLNAGTEMSVASTKAFIAQVIALRLFTLALAKQLGILPKDKELSFKEHCQNLRESMVSMLAYDEEIRTIAHKLLQQDRMLFLGRGDFFPVALEGALKIKELSYIFAEGYPAGELKHGPIALVDQNMLAVVIFGNDALDVKTASNLQEIKARGAKIFGIAPKGIPDVKDDCDFYLPYDDSDPLLEPILATIPLQLLAYHISDLKGIDVDKPRNLAKSVTVE
jgi:glutamine---fructose-6-phosphate transaminase (isomerizing)